jgi:broad specificity phosphatase PhoE
MPRLYLVRHAKPAARWGEDADPGLDPLCHDQARATALHLAHSLAPVPIYTSPMRRCRETAQPLEQSWNRPAELLLPVAEIPSPPIDLAARQEWLAAAMNGTWAELQSSSPAGSIDYLAWRRALLDALTAIRQDCVIFTHYIAINAAAAAAQGDDRVVCFRPDHASVTVVETRDSRLERVELGREADTLVLTRR